MHRFERLNKTYSWYNEKDWIQIFRNNRHCFVNTSSGQQFTIDRVDLYSQHLVDIYRMRATCPLANTPKIMLPDKIVSRRYLDLWVQRARYKLDKALKKISSQILILHLLKQLICIIEAIVRKYGFFRLTPNMIKINKGNFFQIWINEFQQCCHRQYPLNSRNIYDDYKQMLRDLINIFSQYGQMKSIQCFKQIIQQQKFLSFQISKSIIQTLVNKNNSTISRSITSISTNRSRVPSFLKNKTNKKEQKGFDNPETNKKQLKRIKSQDYLIKQQSQTSSELTVPPNIYCLNFSIREKKSQIFKRKSNISNSSLEKDYKNDPNLGKTQNLVGQTLKSYSSQKAIGVKKCRDSGDTQQSTNLLHSFHSSVKSRQFQQNSNVSSNEKKMHISVRLPKNNNSVYDKFQIQFSRIIQQGPQDLPTSQRDEHPILRVVQSQNQNMDSIHVQDQVQQQNDQVNEEMLNLLQNN